MKRSTDRVLTTHVGSLLKPPEVLAFIQAKADGQPIDEHAFTQTLRTAVDEVVRQQAAAGVDVPSDGEFGKSAWTNYVVERMSGFELRTVPRPPVTFLGAEAEGRFAGYYEQMSLQNLGRPRLETSIRMVCTGPIAYTGKAIMQRDVDNFRAALEHVQVEEAFLPVVAPASIAVDHANEFYPSEEAYLFAVAEALHEEYQTIVDAGLIVQVDDAILTNMYDAVVASAASPKIASATTCAGAVGRARTPAMCRCARSSTCCSRSTPRGTRSRRPTRAMSTSGRSGATRSCRRGRFCCRASSATPSATSSIRS
jgi:5-methyltetrahydropteroyltriglutamate--homocysteine methyltransferase